MLTDAIGEEDGQLEEDLSSGLYPDSPLMNNIHRRQIKHFELCLVGRKDAPAFGNFTKLSVVEITEFSD